MAHLFFIYENLGLNTYWMQNFPCIYILYVSGTLWWDIQCKVKLHSGQRKVALRYQGKTGILQETLSAQIFFPTFTMTKTATGKPWMTQILSVTPTPPQKCDIAWGLDCRWEMKEARGHTRQLNVPITILTWPTKESSCEPWTRKLCRWFENFGLFSRCNFKLNHMDIYHMRRRKRISKGNFKTNTTQTLLNI